MIQTHHDGHVSDESAVISDVSAFQVTRSVWYLHVTNRTPPTYHTL